MAGACLTHDGGILHAPTAEALGEPVGQPTGFACRTRTALDRRSRVMTGVALLTIFVLASSSGSR